ATDTATVDQAAGLGADGYIVKPFQAGQVNACMAPFVPAPAANDGAGRGAETPQATMARLGIGGERLLIYLGGLQAQLSAAGAELAALLARGDHESARAQLNRLHAGCLTLGLEAAALALRSMSADPLDAAQVQAALADTVRDVMHQSDAVAGGCLPA
ncbi:MAG: response regulator, partial [Massilia sp.]|nr:response regulator [Massilia sp.]